MRKRFVYILFKLFVAWWLFPFLLISLICFSCSFVILNGQYQGPVSRKSGTLFGPEKPSVKLRPASSGKPVFSYVVKGIKIKINAKSRASRRYRFEDTMRIMWPEMRRKVSGLSRNGPQYLKRSQKSTEYWQELLMCCALQESDNKAEGIEQEETIDEHPSSPGWLLY